MNKSQYRIETFSQAQNKWVLFFPFDCMQKSFAQGAWSMLQSFYNHRTIYRLVKDGEVVEECSKQTIKLN